MVDTVPSPNFASASNTRKNDLFIAYTIEDIEFVKKLDTALRELGRNPWLDLEDIPYNINRTPEETWQHIHEGIQEADVFVFVISPNSIQSAKNLKELEFAIHNQKPIIPVVCHSVGDLAIPDALQDEAAWIQINLNDPNDPFEPLATRITYIHIYERLRQRAQEWVADKTNTDLLLYRSDLESVKAWIGQNTSEKLGLTALQTEYFEASKQAERRHLLPYQPDVFVSYSRRDKEFVAALCQALKQNKVKIWVDWENIPVAAPWREELKEGIRNADNFLFVMSSDSVASRYCHEEIEQAAAYKKRVITILLNKDYDRNQVHDAVKERNWIVLNSAGELDATMPKLLEAIQRDEKHVKTHTNLLLRAIEWDEHKRKEEFLLRGNKLREALQWLRNSQSTRDGEPKEPRPTDLQRDFLQTSHKHRRRTRLIRGLAIGLTSVGLVSALVVIAVKTLGEIKALVSSLEGKQELDALMVSLKAGHDLERQRFSSLLNWVNLNPQAQVVTALHQSIDDLNERNRLERHQGRIYQVSFLESTDLIASAGQDGTIQLWQKDGTPIATPLFGHTDDVVAIDFFPEQQQLVSASYDGTVKLWQILTNVDGSIRVKFIKTLTSFGRTGLSHDDWVYDVKFSPDHKYIASASQDGTIKIWTVQGDYQATLPVGQPVYNMAFSPDGQTLASASNDGIRLWTGKNFSQVKLLPDTESSFWVSFSPDGKRLVSSGNNAQIKLWQPNGTLIATLKGHEAAVYRAVFSHDSKVLASASGDNTVKLWNGKTGDWLRTLSGHQDAVYRVKFSPDDRTLASAGADDTIRLWQPQGLLSSPTKETVEFWAQKDNGSLLKTLTGHRNAILDIDFSKDGETLASASADASIRLWQTNNDTVPRLRHDFPVTDVSFSSSGQFLASSSSANLFFWQPQGTLIGQIKNAGGKGKINTLSFSPQGNLLATAGEDGVQLWHLPLNSAGQLQPPCPQKQSNPRLFWEIELEQRRLQTECPSSLLTFLLQAQNESQPKAVLSLSFSSNGQFLAIGGEEPFVRIWEQTDQKMQKLSVQGITTSLTFYPLDDRFLVAAGKRNAPSSPAPGIVLLQRQTDQPIQTIRQFRDEVLGNINSVRFSPDGKFLAAADETNNSIRLWSVSRSQNQLHFEPFKTLQGHTAPVLQLTYSSDAENPLLASASQDGTVKLWTATGSEIITFRKHRRDVSGVSFKPDGSMLASASVDRDVLLYSLPAGFSDEALQVLIRQGCELAKDYLKIDRVNEIYGQEEFSQIQQNKEACKAE